MAARRGAPPRPRRSRLDRDLRTWIVAMTVVGLIVAGLVASGILAPPEGRDGDTPTEVVDP